MSHVRSSILRRVEEYVRKLMLLDSSVLFDRIAELSGPTSEPRESEFSKLLTEALRLVVNAPQYFSVLEYDLRKAASGATKALETFRDSLETSVALSSLLAGTLITVALLVMVVVRGVP
ncbi:MAG: hypothetical protein LM564_04510 [Desulfurococcaceae archaeon]|nr:hypothetical protein [Desulfurococcaceae archaeon]